MICKKCGATIPEGSKFCVYCGEKVEEEIVQQEVQEEKLPFTDDEEIKEESKNEETVDIQKKVVFNEHGVVIAAKDEEIPAVEEEKPTEQVTETPAVEEETPTEPVEEKVKEETPTTEQVTETPVVENVQPMAPSVPEAQTSSEVQPIAPVATKKSKSKLILLIGIIAAVLVVGAGLLVFLLNRNTNSIDVLEKALANTIEDKNGTIKLSANIESDAGVSLDLSLVGKYVLTNDEYKLQMTLNKSIFSDELSLYAIMNKDGINAYIPSKLIDLMGSTSSDTNLWLNYSSNDEEIKEAFEEYQEEIYNNSGSVDLSEFLDNEDFVYVDDIDGAKHYQLKITKKLMIKIQKLVDEANDETENTDYDEEDIDFDEFNIDFYIKDNKIQKISIDLGKMGNDIEVQGTISIEFSDIGSTTIEIPADVKKSTLDINTYYSTYLTSEDYDYDDEDLDLDF